MARTTPRIEGNALVLPGERSSSSTLYPGSPQWYAWLADEQTSSFFFSNESGSFTARKERRKRGGWYWIAYRSHRGKLYKAYLGRSEKLTPALLQHTAQSLAAPSVLTETQSEPRAMLRLEPLPIGQSSNLLERSELLAYLDHCLQVKLLLVTAPAGFGKTTLLSQWYTFHEAQGSADLLAWISLDDQDNNPVRFWNLLWNALQGRKHAPLLDFFGPLYSTPQMSIETILVALMNGWDPQRNCVLILDDYQVITLPEIHHGMDFLLSHMPPALHLVISSRTEPPLALGRARLYGALPVLSARELRCTSEEIRRFVHISAGITLTAEEVALLENRTEGWIAGLQLIGMALRDRADLQGTLAKFTGSQRALFDYFAEEVFARQSVEIQRFLLATAVLTELTPPLCEALLAEEGLRIPAWNLLERLERGNVFLLSSGGQRYRYHPLFSEFLREKLLHTAPERISALHRCISRYYEQQGNSADAIAHALAAHDEPSARRLIVTVGEEVLWKKGEVGQLFNWIKSLEEIYAEQHPQLALLSAWALLLSGQDHFADVEKLLNILERDECGVQANFPGEVAALRARMAAFRDDVPAVRHFARQALRELPEERALLRADVAFGVSGTYRDLDMNYRMLSEAMQMSLRAGSLRTGMFASRYLAVTCKEQGKLAEAEVILRRALRSAEGDRRASVPITGVIHIGLAELCYERNELSSALQHATLGTQLGEQSGEIKAILAGYCVLAQIFLARGQYEQAGQEIERIAHIVLQGNISWLNIQLAVLSLSLALVQGRLVEAEHALRSIEIDPGCSVASAPQDCIKRLLLARIWLAQERYSDIVPLLEEAASEARANKRRNVYLLALTLQALALQRQKRQVTAVLREILAWAGPEHFTRLFLDLGEPLLALLQTDGLDKDTRKGASYLLKAAGLPSVLKRNRSGLSEREQEILHLLAAGMSNGEIAEQLVIAPSTVKVHVRHICQKLNVQRRAQAVARARESGLFSALDGPTL